MAKKKKLQSGFVLDGIAPNLLLKDIENTAPFIFSREIDTSKPHRKFIENIIHHKKNLKQINHINIYEYFYLCLCAHWSTAGTYVPTDVDNQIRQKLWLHPQAKKHLQKMIDLSIDAWSWDYSEVTKRKYTNSDGICMSTHEGTWLSVIIGAYCAAKKFNLPTDAIEEVILKEVHKEQDYLIDLKEKQDAIGFIKATPLIAHNFGDLDRVMVAWGMHESDSFCKSIYRLGHDISDTYSPIIVYGGKVNKEFTCHENHRHLSLRKTKALRKSKELLVTVGPFMDDMGKNIANYNDLSLEEIAEIIICLWEGVNRQEEAFGYMRVFAQICKGLENGFSTLEPYMAFDVFQAIKKSKMFEHLNISQEEFELPYIQRLKNFKVDGINISYNS